MGWTCSSDGTDEKYIQNFGRENLFKGNKLRDGPYWTGKIILKRTFQKGCEDVRRMEPVQNRIRWQALVLAVFNFPVLLTEN
jgi:hypothetical protein